MIHKLKLKQMNIKNTITEHYRKFFDLHAKGIALDEDDYLNIDWAEDLVKNCFIPNDMPRISHFVSEIGQEYKADDEAVLLEIQDGKLRFYEIGYDFERIYLTPIYAKPMLCEVFLQIVETEKRILTIVSKNKMLSDVEKTIIEKEYGKIICVGNNVGSDTGVLLNFT